MPRGVRASAGNRRPRSPRPAAPSRASATACSTTSPSEWPASRGAPGISMPPRRRPRAGTERVAVVAEADAHGRRGERLFDPAQVVGQRHLEVRGFTGDRMDRDGTGLEQGGLVGELRGAIGRERRPGVEQQAAARALRRLGGGERRAVHRLEHQALPHPLEGLGDRQRPGSAAPWRLDGLGDGRHERRATRAAARRRGRGPGRSRPAGSMGVEVAHAGGDGLPGAWRRPRRPRSTAGGQPRGRPPRRPRAPAP